MRVISSEKMKHLNIQQQLAVSKVSANNLTKTQQI